MSTSFLVTGYCPCEKCCGKKADPKDIGKTKSGVYDKANHTLAAPSTYSFGTKIELEGYGIKSVDNLDETKPVVVFASPGFMQSGLSKTLFEKWCSDDKNGICITGYCVDGTLARFLLGSPPEVKLTNGKTENMRMKISNVTFSAHSDFKHTNEFIQILKPKNIIFER